MVWEFDESEFINTGIPAKIHDIPIASPCFINNDNSETNVLNQDMWNGTPYPAFFSYNSEAKPSVISVADVAPALLIIIPSFNLAKGSKAFFVYILSNIIIIYSLLKNNFNFFITSPNLFYLRFQVYGLRQRLPHRKL